MIYIVRHGQTDWNKERKIQGHQDIPLNEVGIHEAEIVRDELKDIKFDVVFSSPLQRAYKTAQIITNNPIIIEPRLIERYNGKLEGQNFDQVLSTIPWNEDVDNDYGIEKIGDLRKRVYEFLDEVNNNYYGKEVLIVTHAGNGIQIRCYFEGNPENNDYGSYRIHNCQVLKYEYKKR